MNNLQILKTENIVKQLRAIFGEAVLNINSLPKAYYINKADVKAIYLGCDPSNQHNHKLKFAFAIESGVDMFKGFITQHKNNLKEVGLSFDKVYVQNLCQNYFKNETSKNIKVWKAAANSFWIGFTKKELDSHFDTSVPVLLTSQYLLEVLGNDKWNKIQAPDFYQCKVSIPIPADENKLGRPLIPMYRGKSRSFNVSYHLKNKEWENYKSRIIEILRS